MNSADSPVIPSPLSQRSARIFTFSGDFDLKPCAGETVRLFPDLFQYVRTMVKREGCRLPIHDVLYYTRDEGEFCLISSKSGEIRCFEGQSAVTQFFHSSKFKSVVDEGFVYAFQTDSANYSYFSTSDGASKIWKSTSAPCKRIVKLSLHCRSARSIRIVWSRTEGTTRTLEQTSFGSAQPKNTRRELRFKTSLATPKACHSSHLQKSSFSPFLPYSCVAAPSQPGSSLTPTYKRKPIPAFSHSKTCASAGLQCEWLSETVPVSLELEKEVTMVVKRMVRPNDVLDSFCYDLEEETPSQWKVLCVKWIDTVASRTSEMSTSPSEGSSSARMRTLQHRFAAVLTPRSGKRPPYIDTAEIHQMNIDRYLRSVTALPTERSPRSSDPTLTPITESLSTISHKFDCLMSAASSFRSTHKEGQRVKLENYRPDILDLVIERVYAKVRSEPTLRSFFDRKNRMEINMIKVSFAKAFSGVENCYFRKSVKSVHTGLGITSTQFTCFLRIFRETMSEEGIRPPDIETVLKYLSRFSLDIIEDET